jgi:ATP-binding cassette subfamily G (WHITE) protein 2 (SNQ2)
VSIYQAGEQLYEVFDKVCLIYEGRMVYYGPANQARQYFLDMGYVPKNRQTTADFLVSVTDPLGRHTRDEITSQEGDVDGGIEKEKGIVVDHESGSPLKPIPHTADEFEAYYMDSEVRKWNLEDMAAYKRDFVDSKEVAAAFEESAKEEHARHTRRQVCFGSLSARIGMLMQLNIEPIYDLTSYAGQDRAAEARADHEGQLDCTGPPDDVSSSRAVALPS